MIVGGEAGNNDQCQTFKDLCSCPQAIWTLSSRHGKPLRFLRNGDMSSKLHFRKISHIAMRRGDKKRKRLVCGGVTQLKPTCWCWDDGERWWQLELREGHRVGPQAQPLKEVARRWLRCEGEIVWRWQEAANPGLSECWYAVCNWGRTYERTSGFGEENELSVEHVACESLAGIQWRMFRCSWGGWGGGEELLCT